MAIIARAIKTLTDLFDGISIVLVDVEYYLSTSAESLTEGSWSTTSPAWVNGKYMWSRTKTIYSEGEPTYSEPACITGAAGATGTGISSITEEYYLSDSETERTGGSWVTTLPMWSTGKYIWTRSKIVYTNPESTDYTTPVCDTRWGVVDERITTAETSITSNAEQIALRATKTEVSTLTGRMTDAETSLTLKADSATLTSIKNDLQSQINLVPGQIDLAVGGVQVGGTNHATGDTGTPFILSTWNGQEDQTSYTTWRVIVDPAWKPGDTITISCYYQLSNIAWSGGRLRVRIQGRGDVTAWTPGLIVTPIDPDGGNFIYYSPDGVTSGSGFNLSGRAVFTIVATAAWLSNNYFPVSIRSDLVTAGTVKVWNFQAERGNKATDWSPSPRDTDARIDEAETRITQTQEQISAKASQSSVDALGNRVTSAESSISLVPGQIDLAVGNVQVGGRNLAYGTNQGAAGWGWSMQTGSATITDVAYNDIQCAKMTRNGTAAGSWSVIYFDNIGRSKYMPDTDYTVSFEVLSSVTTAMVCDLRDSDGTDILADMTDAIQSTVTANKWSKIVMRVKTVATLPSSTTQVVYITTMDSTPNVWYVFRNLKIEVGNVATDWTPSLDEFRAGSSISLTKDGARISAPSTVISVPKSASDETEVARFDKDGVYADVASSPTLKAVYRGPSNVYVDPAATQAQIEAGTHFKSIGAALNALNHKSLVQNVEVNLKQSTVFYENVFVNGIDGAGRLRFRTTDSPTAATSYATIFGRVSIIGCGRIMVERLKVQASLTTGAFNFVSATDCRYLVLENSIFSATTGVSTMVNSDSGSLVYVNRCEFYDTVLTNAAYTFFANIGSSIMIRECKGNVGASRVMVTHVGGEIAAITSIPYSTTSDPGAWNNGEIRATGVTMDAGSIPPVEPPITEYTYNAVDSRTRASSGGWWSTGDRTIRQGWTSGSAVLRGAIWFNNATLRSNLSGKTVKSATLTLSCVSGVGLGNAQAIGLAGITNAEASGSIAGEKVYDTLDTLEWGETKEMAIPLEAINDLKNGVINALVIYSGETSADNYDSRGYSKRYRKCEGYGTSGAPVLTVTTG